MINVTDTPGLLPDPNGIAPRRRACWPTKAQQSTRGVTP
jgi:hypothetical protein